MAINIQSRVAVRLRPGLSSCIAKPALSPLPAIVTRTIPLYVRGSSVTCSSSAASPSSSGGDSPDVNRTTEPKAKPSPGVLGRIKRFFLGDQLDKAKLAQLGMGAFASYGFISNVTYGICFGIAWISFVKATGLSPLAPGQWPAFLGFYAGLWTMQNFVRPLRFSLAIAVAPLFERLILWISNKTGLEKQWAFGLYLTCFAITTIVVLFGSIYLLGGFPTATP